MESGCASPHMNALGVKRKMAAVSAVPLLLLCCCLVASTDPQDVCDHYAATNGNFTVPLTLRSALDGSETLRWAHNDETILNRKKDMFIKGRREDLHENGSLKLRNLKKSDTGKYTPGVWINDGKSVGNLKSIHLCVVDPVQEPSVRSECSKTSVKFTCAVGQVRTTRRYASSQNHVNEEAFVVLLPSNAAINGILTQQAKDLTFEWLRNNVVLANQKGGTLTLAADLVETGGFRCKVSNRVSSRTSATVNCLKTRFFPKELFGINTWIIVGGGGGVVLVLIIVVIVCCVRTRRKKHRHQKEEDELRLTWTDPNQQRHCHHQHAHPPNQNHHHHQQQQQAPGHTGPRQHRSRHHQRPRGPEQPNALPQPSPRRPVQGPRPDVNNEQPPLPQPRKKAPKTPRV